MSLNDQFDELARQKLEERAFPFDEGAWQRAQHAIATQGRRRRKPIWYLSGAAAIGFVIWMLWPAAEEARQAEPAQVAQRTEAARIETAETKGPTQGQGDEAALTIDGSEDRVRTSDRPKETRPSGAQNISTTRDLPTLARSDLPARASDSPTAERSLEGGTSSRPDGQTAFEPVEADLLQSPTETPGGIEVAPAPTTALSSEPDEPASAIPVVADALDSPSLGDVEVPGGESNALISVETNAVDAVDPIGLNADDGAPVTSASGVEEPVRTGESEEPVAAASEPTTSPADSASTAPALAAPMFANDTAAASVPEPTPAPLVGPRSPWELSLLAGAFSTASKYVLPQIQEWSATPVRTSSFAAEAVRMGRNFGYGVGLHYGTYADRLSTPEETRSDVNLSRYWFLQGVDTTILIITGGDSINGYTGINVSTTVQVLRSAYDTSATTSLVRPARAQVVRTSYVELPLLLDAHLVQGRWSIGLRGGPTVGMLTARSGALPGPGEGGYTDLNGMAVRRTVIGWTARAYLRYRFNSAWSLGLEPAARGQITDGIDDRGARRRSNAFGALLSLSYRLR